MNQLAEGPKECCGLIMNGATTTTSSSYLRYVIAPEETSALPSKKHQNGIRVNGEDVGVSLEQGRVTKMRPTSLNVNHLNYNTDLKKFVR